MAKRKVIVEVVINDDKVRSIEDLERDILHQCYGTFRLDFLCPKSILVPTFYRFFSVVYDEQRFKDKKIRKVYPITVKLW
jgi:hypothetical protein